jgi:hypothetical protein
MDSARHGAQEALVLFHDLSDLVVVLGLLMWTHHCRKPLRELKTTTDPRGHVFEDVKHVTIGSLRETGIVLRLLLNIHRWKLFQHACGGNTVIVFMQRT